MIFLELPDSADVIDDNADDAEAEAEAEAEVEAEADADIWNEWNEWNGSIIL